MPDPESELEIPPFPIEDLLTSQDREDIKACAEDLVSSEGEEPIYLTKPQMDERLETLRGFKGSFLETGDPLATGETTGAGGPVFFESGAGDGKVADEPVGGGEPSEVAPAETVAATVAATAVAGSAAAATPGPGAAAVAEASPPPLPVEGKAEDEPGADARPDRRVSMVFFGAGLVGVGALWAMIGTLLFMGFEQADGGAAGVSVPVLWCGGWAVTYLVLGFGNVSLRRWARALTVVAGWVWMAIGVLAVVAIGLFFAELTAAVDAAGVGQSLVSGGAEDLMVGLLGCVALMTIFVPGVMILYASAPSVKATCEKWDRSESWAERRAPGMLVFGWLMGCVAFFYGAAAAHDSWFLWYGTVVEGLAAQQVYAGACGASLVLAVLTLDMRRGIWWALLVGVAAGSGVMAGPWVAFLGGMEVPLEAEALPFSLVTAGGLVTGIWAALLVFVLFLRRCLPKGDAGDEAADEGGGESEGEGGEPVVEGA